MAYLKQNLKVGSPTQTTVTIGNTSTAVLGANAARAFLILQNDSDEVIYVAIDGGVAVSGQGIRLNASGGTAFFDRFIPQTAITAICASGTKDLLVTEASG